MDKAKPIAKDQNHQLWRVRLCSALRTTLACTIVGCTTLYGPAPLRDFLAFPAFAYLTSVLIVSDATLGDALRGCWHAFLASIQVIPLSMLILWMVGAEHFTKGLAALVVVVGAFGVALPESTHIMAKRIAFGQIVTVYVGAVVHGAKANFVMHPLHVASSTALGAFASVLAMLFPYPRLAYFQLKRSRRLYAENALERLNLFYEALLAKDSSTANDSISRSAYYTQRGRRILQSIKNNQEGMLWEIPQIAFLKSQCIIGEDFQDIEIQMKGMEIALSFCTSFPVSIVDEAMTDALGSMKAELALKLEQAKSTAYFSSTMVPETEQESPDKCLDTLKTMPTNQEDLPAFFFLHCMRLLQGDPFIVQHSKPLKEMVNESRPSDSWDPQHQAKSGFNNFLIGFLTGPDSERLLFSIKCSISLGLAVLFGLIFNKENGYWAGLTIAISFGTERQATFMASNSRAQGTAMGSVYGVLCCYIFQKFWHLRLLALIPWIIFTSFLKHSRMYGQAGAISALIGALLILGRNNYGLPSEFAITRITESCIGLICLIMVETILQPARAATLAKIELSRCLGKLRDCVEAISLRSDPEISPTFRETYRKLTFNVKRLQQFVAEAEEEPSFWFLPFNCAGYNKLVASLSNVTDLLVSMIRILEFLSQDLQKSGIWGMDLQDQIYDDLKLLKSRVCASLKLLGEVTLIKSLAQLDRELTRKNISQDIESGIFPKSSGFKGLQSDEGEITTILNSLLQHLKEAAIGIEAREGEKKLKSPTILALSGVCFCIGSLMREMVGIEKEIKEQLLWENPSSHIDLNEICCKLNTLQARQI